MPYSYNFFKDEVRQHFAEHVSIHCKILDVGPGSGTYSKLLKPLGYKLDCIEVWEPYVKQFSLPDHYGKVIVQDIMKFDISDYEYLIMGDVLEHLSVENATLLLSEVEKHKIRCLVAVPFLYEQSSHEGNEFETHLQPDLTFKLVRKRYKSLNLLFGNKYYGYYTNYFKLSTIGRIKHITSTLLKR